MPAISPLLALIRDEILRQGPITFARFMELALYQPEYGYYAQAPTIGRKGDFYTSVSVGPIFGLMLARQWAEIWDQLGRPASFALIEQAAHNGQLASDIMTALHQYHPACYAAVTYHIIEPQPRLQTIQQQTLHSGSNAHKVSWWSRPQDMPPQPHGVFFCNELVDSFPVHRVIYRNAQWHELKVNWQDDQLCWKETPPSAELLLPLASSPCPAIENYTTELNLQIQPWLSSIAPLLQQGVFLIIDYGFPAAIYYHPDRHDGTLQCYHQHRKSSDPFQQVGAQDITTHVDFTRIEQAGQTLGLTALGWTDQHHFLAALLEKNPEIDPALRAGLKTLLHPEMMGTRFHYLGLGKSCNLAGKISGLQYARPLV